MNTETSFPAQLAPLVEAVGEAHAAAICGVHRRTIKHWLAGLHLPNKSTQAGAVMLLDCHLEAETTGTTIGALEA